MEKDYASMSREALLASIRNLDTARKEERRQLEFCIAEQRRTIERMQAEHAHLLDDLTSVQERYAQLQEQVRGENN